jgi:hypothetical protein
MGLILSEPIKKVVEIPKILAKFSVEDAKIHPNALTGPAHRPGEKGEKNKKKHQRRFFAEKTVFLRKSCVFACLAPNGELRRANVVLARGTRCLGYGMASIVEDVVFSCGARVGGGGEGSARARKNAPRRRRVFAPVID